MIDSPDIFIYTKYIGVWTFELWRTASVTVAQDTKTDHSIKLQAVHVCVGDTCKGLHGFSYKYLPKRC